MSAGNPQDVMRARYEAVYGSPEGRAVLDDILAASGIRSDPFDPNSDSATAYRCGKAAVGRRILNYLGDAKP